MKPCLLVFWLFMASCVRLFAANCPVGGTTIFFGNGLNNDYVTASRYATKLRARLQSQIAQDGAIDPSCIGYGLAFNAQVVTVDYPWLKGFENFLVQGGFSSLQLVVQYVGDLWNFLLSGVGAPTSAELALGKVLNNAMIVFQPDLTRQVSQYQFEMNHGNKLIVVAHSQGNLYVNQAYTLLSPPQPPLQSTFDVVAVATPANGTDVPGGGPYITLNNDWINWVPGTSLPNSDNGPCGSPFACHNFENSYLPGQDSGPRIIYDAISFIPIPITVTITGTGSGKVTSTPQGLLCDSTSSTSPCSAAFDTDSNRNMTLTAVERDGTKFSKWTGNCTQGGFINGNDITFQISLTVKNTCTAEFDDVLTLAKSGTGTGTVTSAPPGISCGPLCTTPQMAPFPAAPPVLLMVTRAAGSIFSSWGGDCASAGSNPTAQVTLDANKTCNAKFDLGGSLTITKGGAGTGTVTSVPAGINCAPTCTTQNAPFPASPPVQLTAAAASGSSFTSWGGDCASAGTNTTAQITLTSDKNCTATFGSANPAVRLNPFGSQMGAGPYNVEVVDRNLMLTAAPQDITVTLLRDVISQCSGLLFSSNRTVVVSLGQSSASYNFNAGHDPACNTLPITTRYTVTRAVLGTNTALDLSAVPAQQLVLSVTR